MSTARINLGKAALEAFDWFARGTAVGLLGTALLRLSPASMSTPSETPEVVAAVGLSEQPGPAVVVVAREREATSKELAPRARRSRGLRAADRSPSSRRTQDAEPPRPPASTPYANIYQRRGRELIQSCRDADAVLAGLDAHLQDPCLARYAHAAARILHDKRQRCELWDTEGLGDVVLHLVRGKKDCGPWAAERLAKLAGRSDR